MLTLFMASYGICFGLMNEKILALNQLLYRLPLFRDEDGDNFFQRMFVCSFCTAFHSGLVVWVMKFGLFPINWGEILTFSLASSAFCYSLDSVIQWFEITDEN